MEPLSAFATTGLQKILADVTKTASGILKNKIGEKITAKVLEKALKNLSEVENVRTLVNPGKICNLYDVYVPEAVSFEGLDSLTNVDFFGQKKVLIEAVAGSGKSFFMRHLCAVERKREQYIPVFIEFRNLDSKANLTDALIKHLNELGIDVDLEILTVLLKSSRLLLLFDGFDEILPSERSRLARELESLARAYSTAKIIISSRPNAGLGGSVYYHTFPILPLNNKTKELFVTKLSDNQHQKETILEVIFCSDNLPEVTASPLLLTLFIIIFKAGQFKPDSVAEFYRQIFLTMLYRHDSTKVGFERQRKSGLGDLTIRKLFEIICFLTQKNDDLRPSRFDLLNYIQQSFEIDSVSPVKPELLLSDYTEITGLLMADGHEAYSFAHKSIQEFFSAYFISRQLETSKKEFYEAIVGNDEKAAKWRNTLFFLSNIDQASYLRYYLLTTKKRLLGLDENSSANVGYSDVIAVLGQDTRIKATENGEFIEIYWDDMVASSEFIEFTSAVKSSIKSFLKSNPNVVAEYLEFCPESDYENYRFSDQKFVFNLRGLIDSENLVDQILLAVNVSISNSNVIDEVISLEARVNESFNLSRSLVSV